MAERDVVARWSVPMCNNIYNIEFCHGTTTGRRILRVNGKEILHRDWMFKLVGRECFELNGVCCVVSIEAVGIFAYEYSLKVGGKTFDKFREQQNRALQVWHVRLGSGGGAAPIAGGDSADAKSDARICLEKNTMDVWVNGVKANTAGEFIESGGTRTHFEVHASPPDTNPKGSSDGGDDALPPRQLTACYIETESSGRRAVGVLHKLYVDGVYVPPAGDST